jgi:hypothetical protein
LRNVLNVITRTDKTSSYENRQSYIEENESLQEMTKHHRKPKSKGGSDAPENISIVPKKKHAYFHALFGTKSPQQIADYLTNVWIDSSFKIIAIKK